MEKDTLLIYNFKTGVITELYKKGLITKAQMEKAIKLLKQKEHKQC